MLCSRHKNVSAVTKQAVTTNLPEPRNEANKERCKDAKRAAV